METVQKKEKKKKKDSSYLAIVWLKDFFSETPSDLLIFIQREGFYLLFSVLFSRLPTLLKNASNHF